MINFLFLIFLPLLSNVDTKTHNQKISKDVLEKLARVKSLSDFRQIFNIKEPLSKRTSSNSTVVTEFVEPAECKLRSVPVVLGGDSASDYVYMPACIPVDRCSGCGYKCVPAGIKECGPTSSVSMKINVYKLLHKDWVTVTLPYVKHTSCGCTCIRKPSVCIEGRETWDADTCQCKCHVKRGEIPCEANQQWVPEDCDCICKKVCHKGETQNKKTCECNSQKDNLQGDNMLEDSYQEESYQGDGYQEDSSQNDSKQQLVREDDLYYDRFF